MPLARTHFRSRSRSPAPSAAQSITASRTPVFLPPSHYAAAAGLDYEAIARSRGEGPSPRLPQEPGYSAFEPGFNPASPLSYPTQTEVIESTAQVASVSHHSGLNRVSRFIARSPSLGKASAARRASKLDEKEKAEATHRQSRMMDLPLVELQLIPTLRDTIDKMTHPPTPISTHEDEAVDGAIVYAKAYTSADGDGDHSSASSQASSCFSAAPSTRQSTTGTDSLDNHPLLRPPKPTKSAMRSPSPATRRRLDAASSTTPSLRPSTVLVSQDSPLSVSPGYAAAGCVTTEHSSPGPSRIPGAIKARSRFTANQTPTIIPSQLPLPQARPSARFGLGPKSSTPQPPPALRPGYPGFKTPQPAQEAFVLRPTLPRAANNNGNDNERIDPSSSLRGRTNLPRLARKNGHRDDSASGSELERCVNSGLGRLIVTNAQIVPSSSEESASAERARAGAYNALAKKTATGVPNPQCRAAAPQHAAVTAQQNRTTDAGRGWARDVVDRGSRVLGGHTIGLGFRMSPRVDADLRHHPEDEEQESVYDEDDQHEQGAHMSDASEADDRDSDGHEADYADEDSEHSASPQSLRQRTRFDRPSERESETNLDRRKRLSGIVDGLQASYGTQRSPGKSILSQSESDVYYEQDLAIGTSSDFPNSSMGDVSLDVSNAAHRQDERTGEQSSDEDEERSNYSEESEDSFSIVVDDEEDRDVQPGSPWWMRGRCSPKASDGAANASSIASPGRNADPRRISVANSIRSRLEDQSDACQPSAVENLRAVSTRIPTPKNPSGPSQHESERMNDADRASRRTRIVETSSTTPDDIRSRHRTMMLSADKSTSERTPQLSSWLSASNEVATQSSAELLAKTTKPERRMTMSFTKRFARPSSRRSSVLEDDADRTPRVSSQDTSFFPSPGGDPDEAVDSDDCAERERQAFGIPRSLSFQGAGHPASDSERTDSDTPDRPSALLRSESDESLLGGPSAMTRESSYMAHVWRESHGKDVLSKGAHELFAGLVVQPWDSGVPSHVPSTEKRERPPSLREGTRSRPVQREERTRAMQEREQPRQEPEQPVQEYEQPMQEYEQPISTSLRRQSRHRDRRSLSHHRELDSSRSQMPDPIREPLQQTDPPTALPPATAGTSWRSTVQADVYGALLTRYGPMEMQRQEVIYELLQTEREFIRHLRELTSAFVVPLRVHASKTWLPGVPRQVSRLFDWLEDILNLHTAFLRTLKNASRAWQSGTVVIELASDLLSLVPRLEVHQPYLVRVDGVRELVDLWVQDEDAQFGEYIRMREEEGLCGGWSLERCLQLPVQRLVAYLASFTKLLESTHRQHPDYLANLSLLRSTRMVIRVMEEVRTREEEYDFVRDIAARILGSDAAAQLATRERRLLHQGTLYYQSPSKGNVATETIYDTPTVQINGFAMYYDADDVQDKKCRGRRLASAIHDWHVRRARSGSISSASSSLSLWSHDSLASNATPDTPVSDIHTTLQDTSHLTALQIFVFTDVILMAMQADGGGTAQSEWRLFDDVGLSRILDVRMDEDDRLGGRAISFDLIPVNLQDLTSPLQSCAGTVTNLSLRFLQRDDDDSLQDWMAALQRSRANTLHSLCFPPPSPEDVLQGPVGDYEQDTYHCVKSILASGLPMPKSPSMQLEGTDARSQPGTDTTEQEREERGWWSLRFHQVMREFQRQPANGDIVNGMARPQGHSSSVLV